MRITGRRVVAVAAFALLATACKRNENRQRFISAAEADEAVALIGKYKAALAAANSSFRAPSPESLAQIVPGDGACPVTLAVPSDEDAAQFVTSGTSTSTWMYARLAAGKPISAPSVGMVDLVATVERGLQEPNHVMPRDLKALRELVTKPLFSVYVVEQSATDPSVGVEMNHLALETGSIQATAYVFAHDSQRVVCAGRFEARGSSTLSYTYQTTKEPVIVRSPSEGRQEAAAAAMRDFEVHIRRALVASLKAVKS